jgi:hypothetical protein
MLRNEFKSNKNELKIFINLEISKKSIINKFLLNLKKLKKYKKIQNR